MGSTLTLMAGGAGWARDGTTRRASIELATGQSFDLSPLIFGQFIEFLGRGIEGGVFEPGSPLSDADGFRRDVLEKVGGLNAPILRFPGGTYTKIYHWRDGVGPAAQRPVRPNLIWKGNVTNRFGTEEFVRYCRRLDAAPFLTVSMGVGTAEEAANWVEYCNGAVGTSFADERARNGSPRPHNVRYWGLGNEEHAREDAGRLQDPAAYVKEAWLYAKLMKLQDPSISLIAAGAEADWNRIVLEGLHPAVDYLSSHLYISTDDDNPLTLIAKADACEGKINEVRAQIEAFAPRKVENFSQWYRFPPRSNPLMIALDEIGIWETEGDGVHGLENTYNWAHALATATLYNIMIRNGDIVGMATWAQTVNTLAPIMTSPTGSIVQTIYHPMALYRQLVGTKGVKVTVQSPPIRLPGAMDCPSLDVSASIRETDGRVTLFVVNRHPERAIATDLPPTVVAKAKNVQVHRLSSSGLRNTNELSRPQIDVVATWRSARMRPPPRYTFAPMSITALCFEMV